MLSRESDVPPLDRDWLWACPVCGFVPAQQFDSSPGYCIFSTCGGGPHYPNHIHPYSGDEGWGPVDYEKVNVKIERVDHE